MGKRQRRRLREQALMSRQRRSRLVRTSPEEQAVAHLRDLQEQRRRFEAAIEHEIKRLRAGGVGWPPIALALGVTRQAARQRHLRRDPDAAP
jgi:hypothetical protein